MESLDRSQRHPSIPLRPHPRGRERSRAPGGQTIAAPRGAWQEIIIGCRTCARLCSALLDDGDGAGDEMSEMIGDCALTCSALAQLLTSGTRMDRRQALSTCAEDCRAAARACRGSVGDPRRQACELACEECAAACRRQGADDRHDLP